MQIINLKQAIEFNESKFNKKLLCNDAAGKLVLLCLKTGQSVPEHSAPGVVTVIVISGRIQFSEGSEQAEMSKGMVVRLAPRSLHALTALEDSAVFVAISSEAAKQPIAAEIVALDLRSIERPQRHALVFEAVNKLPLGGSLVMTNDHDPLHLQRQMDQLYPGEVSWEYLENGPQDFRLRLTRIAMPTAKSSSSAIA